MKPPLVEVNHVACTSHGGGRPNWLPTTRSNSMRILALLISTRSRGAVVLVVAITVGTSRGWWEVREWEGIGVLRIWDWEIIKRKGDSIEVPFLFINFSPPFSWSLCFSLFFFFLLIYVFVIFLCLYFILSFNVNWKLNNNIQTWGGKWDFYWWYD